jgi:hypothetical protein
MSTYAQLTRKIVRLQARAEELRAAERESVLQGLRETIALYSITAADLGFEVDGLATHVDATPGHGSAAKVVDPVSARPSASLADPPAWIASTTSRMRYLID